MSARTGSVMKKMTSPTEPDPVNSVKSAATRRAGHEKVHAPGVRYSLRCLGRCTLLEFPSLIREHNLHASILLPSGGRGIVRDRIALAATNHLQRDSMQHLG